MCVYVLGYLSNGLARINQICFLCLVQRDPGVLVQPSGVSVVDKDLSFTFPKHSGAEIDLDYL